MPARARSRLQPEEHDLRSDWTIRNALEVVEHRARPAVFTEEEAVVAQLQRSLPDAEPGREHRVGRLFDRGEDLALELCEVGPGLIP